MDVVAGHEPCGRIVGLGPYCKHYKEGARVAVYHISGCGFCEHCRRGYQISGTDLDNRSAYGWQRNGGHAEYLLAEERDLIPLPDALSYEDGSFLSCGVGTAYEGILRGNVSGSDSVLVVGLGPVGMAALMIAKGRGAKKLVGVDVQLDRIQTVRRLGLLHEGFVADDDALACVRAATRGGADVTLDCSGASAGRLLALQATAAWGRCVYIGEQGTVQFRVSEDLMHQQRQIIGSWVTSLWNMEKCGRDLADWGMHPHDLVTHRFSLAEASEAYRVMAEGKCGKVVITFDDAA